MGLLCSMQKHASSEKVQHLQCWSPAQARGISGELLVSVEMVPSLLPMALQPLAAATAALLSRRLDAHSVQGLSSTTCLRTAGQLLQAAYGVFGQGSDAVFA